MRNSIETNGGGMDLISCAGIRSGFDKLRFEAEMHGGDQNGIGNELHGADMDSNSCERNISDEQRKRREGY